MKLIKEDISFNDLEVLTEGKEQKRKFIQGPFLQAEKQNRNGRVYPQHVMDKAVEAYKKDYIAQSRALGELNHPAEPVVNPERAAIMTKELTRDGYYYKGKAQVLSTPMGKIVENLLDDGVKIGVSSRGLGSLRMTRQGYNEVQEDFVLTTAADVVFDPSAQEAFVEGVYEQADWIYESGVWQRIDLEKARKELLEAGRRELNNTKLKLFKRFLENQ
jgi:hypothetical protein|tara:strand:- start:22 stop:672 length:651 start_codon:yes stop_codon:yes gene_type:complete